MQPITTFRSGRSLPSSSTLLSLLALLTVLVAACGQPAPRYSGHSLVVDPLGDVLAEAGDGPDVVRAEITRAALETALRTNPSLRNRRL